jgi:hypothetical protein
MKYCIIGGGAFGINIANILLSKDHEVTLITKNFNSISHNYSRGINFKKIETEWIKNIFFKMNNSNYIWLFLFSIFTFSNAFDYIEYKKYAFKKTMEIMNSYNLARLNEELCDKKYITNIPLIYEKLINKFKSNQKFKLIFNVLQDRSIEELAEEEDYHYVFDCRGSFVQNNYLTENIGGYKINIKADHQNKCFQLEDGWSLHADLKNNYLVAKGGYIIGEKGYDSILDNNSQEVSKISKIIKNKPFWTKYKCQNIVSIRKGTRQYSIDLIPFYTKKNKLISIRGGSAYGCVLAPYVCNCIIDDLLHNKASKYDFSIKRPQKAYFNSIKYIVLFFVFLFLLKRNFKPIVKRYTGIKL